MPTHNDTQNDQRLGWLYGSVLLSIPLPSPLHVTSSIQVLPETGSLDLIYIIIVL